MCYIVRAAYCIYIKGDYMFDPNEEKYWRFTRQSVFRRDEFKDNEVSPDTLVFGVSVVLGILLLMGVLV